MIMTLESLENASACPLSYVLMLEIQVWCLSQFVSETSLLAKGKFSVEEALGTREGNITILSNLSSEKARIQ